MTTEQPQIRQMVNFIYAEAHEKANEIRIQTENAFNRDKLTMVQNERKKINEEFLRKEKEQVIQHRVEKSRQVGDLRLVRMRARETQLGELMTDARSKLASVASSGNYEKIVTALIVQGLIKIAEDDVELLCREKDVAVVRRAKDKAIQDLNARMQKRFNRTRDVTLTVNTQTYLDDACEGGVVLTALDTRIRCDNTLATRLKLAYEEQLPQVRALLYPNTTC